ncbi:ABC transporter substrate-binding protein [Leucobacter sp. OH2974_COT-288]|nr:ABC transporter substrate-binding protein [Leucobacter sp. OH2974_COT-288]
MKIKKVSIVTAALVATLALSGCGGQSLSETPSADNAGSGEVTFTAVPQEELAKATIESLETQADLHAMLPEKYREKLRWTTSVGYAPMELWDSSTKEIIGVDPALAHAISRVLGVELEISDNEFNAQIPGLLSGRYDIIASSMTDNEKRRETTTFVDYVSAGNAFTVNKDNPKEFKAPMDFCGEIIAVVDSGSSSIVAENFSAECVAAGKAAYEILGFDGEESADLAVASGRATATISDYPVAAYKEAQNEPIRVVPIAGEKSLWGFGVSNDNAELAKAVAAALQYLIDNGHYQQILDAWNVSDLAVEKATINGG